MTAGLKWLSASEPAEWVDDTSSVLKCVVLIEFEAQKFDHRPLTQCRFVRIHLRLVRRDGRFVRLIVQVQTTVADERIDDQYAEQLQSNLVAARWKRI